MTNDKATIEAAVRAAFPDGAPPKEVVQSAKNDAERASVKTALSGHRWTAVKHEIVRKHRDVLPLLTAEAFRYYLPAWILTALEGKDDDVADAIVNAVKPREGELDTFHKERTSPFTPAQRSAIAAFLDAAILRAGKDGWPDATAARRHFA